MRRLLMTAMLALSVTLSGCSLQTLGAPKGDLTLTADFDDVQNLVVGHAVKISDVPVGSVTGIKLIGSGTGYRSQVTMSIKNGVKVPAGTSAELSITSLLGENYVRLAPPPGSLVAGGPMLANHAQITSTSVAPAFEEVVGKAGPLLSAVSGNDVAGIVDAGATAFGGKGQQLNTMIKQSNQLLVMFTAQREQLAGAVDDLARLGGQLAKGQRQLSALPDNLAKTTRMLANDRDKILSAVQGLSSLAKTINDTVLVRRTDQLRKLIERLGPSIGTLASDKTNLGQLVTTLTNFVKVLPRAVYNGQLLAFPVLQLVGPDSTGGSTSQGGSAAGARPDILASLKTLLEHAQ
ncbi:MAG: phospholipid/cholesterol/gamma-HCH transport system substrate-binding protein [Streptosporangiaceae bacterium]|jgi:phospholipid/cholesterol/gamma-HCH transport system substrate-binding protein|nr:virulence factor Mce family protein [Streptosporangiaceae bacterium]MDX6430315.1 phospholipid/cholesterol/gamma-HCH transport system substrate-binding protein [Streptosporangiaceae bacterium]